MKWLIDRYAALLDRHHRVVTGFVLVVTIVLTVSVLRLKTDDRLMRALRTEDPKASAEERAFVEQTEHTCLVILSGDEVFSAHGIALVRSLDERLAEIAGVADVDSLNDVHTVRQLGRRRNFLMLLPAADADAERIAQAKERAADHPFTVGQLMTADGRVTSLAVTLDPEITDTASLRPIIKQIKQTVQAAIEGTSFECKFTGMPVIQVQNSEVVVADQVIFNVVGSLAGFLVNCLLLRRLAAVAIVSAGSWLGVFWTFGLFGLVGQPLSPVNGIVAPLAMTIGLTDSIHLLLDIRRMQERGLSRRAAVVAAVRDVGLACTLTTATTIVGFLSLGAAELEILRNLGVCCAMAVTCAYFSVLTVVPLLSMTWLGDRILVPTSAQSKQVNLTSRLADFVFRFRWPVLTLGVLVTLVLGVLSMKLETDTRIAYSLPRQGRETLAYYDRLYQGTIPMILHIEWQPDAGVGRDEVIGVLQQVHQLLGQSEVMSEPLSLLSVLELFPIAEKEGPVAAFGELRFWPEEARDLRDLAIDFEDRSMYVYVRCQDAGTATIADDLSMFAEGFEEISKQYPAFSFRILNSTIMSAPVANKLVADLMRSLLFAIPITLVIVAFALRSAYYGFAGLLPNVFPMVALAAALVMFQQPLLLVGAVVFTISFGIAVDDTIHVLANFKKSYAESGDAAQAIHEVYHKVGGALISSTLILLAGMGVVMLSRTTMVRTFGAMFCITLAFALVADLVLLPAVLACFPPKRPTAPSPEETTEG